MLKIEEQPDGSLKAAECYSEYHWNFVLGFFVYALIMGLFTSFSPIQTEFICQSTSQGAICQVKTIGFWHNHHTWSFTASQFKEASLEQVHTRSGSNYWVTLSIGKTKPYRLILYKTKANAQKHANAINYAIRTDKPLHIIDDEQGIVYGFMGIFWLFCLSMMIYGSQRIVSIWDISRNQLVIERYFAFDRICFRFTYPLDKIQGFTSKRQWGRGLRHQLRAVLISGKQVPLMFFGTRGSNEDDLSKIQAFVERGTRRELSAIS